MKEDTVLELLCHNRHPVTVQLSQSEVVIVWLKSIGEINPGNKKHRGKKGKRGGGSHSPNDSGIAIGRVFDPSPGGAGSRSPALMRAMWAGRQWGRFLCETVTVIALTAFRRTASALA